MHFEQVNTSSALLSHYPGKFGLCIRLLTHRHIDGRGRCTTTAEALTLHLELIVNAVISSALAEGLRRAQGELIA